MAKPGSKKQTGFKVKVTENGPYIATGGIPLSEQNICVDKEDQCHGWKEEKKFPDQETYALCRCGGSHNKPYCDGTHLTSGFDGTETASHATYAERANTTRGPHLLLDDVEDLCARARFCHRADGTWNLTEQSANPEARKTAIEEAGECPSGRLVARELNGKALEPALPPSIGLVHDTQKNKMGPLWLRGGIPVESAEGKPYEARNRVTLCRCGKSANKPFCDGSHLD